MKWIVRLLIIATFFYAIPSLAGNTYNFKEQVDKGYIWNGENFVYVPVAEDIVHSFFYDESADIISFKLFKMISEKDKSCFPSAKVGQMWVFC